MSLNEFVSDLLKHFHREFGPLGSQRYCVYVAAAAGKEAGRQLVRRRLSAFHLADCRSDHVGEVFREIRSYRRCYFNRRD